MKEEKPSEKILREFGFDLSNTIGSSQLEWMLENKEAVINENPAKLLLLILDYLDNLSPLKRNKII